MSSRSLLLATLCFLAVGCAVADGNDGNDDDTGRGEATRDTGRNVDTGTATTEDVTADDACVGAGCECVAELCNGADDDCDGEVDEDFNIRSDPQNCGGCDLLCDPPNAAGACIEGTCGIASCDPGWGDCDGVRANGCETEIATATGCAVCVAAGAVEGGPCGNCGLGTWTCAPDGSIACAGAPPPGTLNRCGGCETLEGAPGDACGTCDSGTWACLTSAEVVCAGDLGDEAVNACGECRSADSCEPGDTESGAACAGGREVRTCGDDCRWGAWDCDTGTEPICTPGATETDARTCGACAEGTQERTRICDGDGAAWSPWSDWGTCATAAACAPGESDRQTESCGDCGGSRERMRSCNTATCEWDGWGDWSACSVVGECVPGDVRDADCDRCAQQVCTASCEWSDCQLRTGATCLWEGGSNWECCADGAWHFCLPDTCQWSSLCEDCTGSGCGC